MELIVFTISIVILIVALSIRESFKSRLARNRFKKVWEDRYTDVSEHNETVISENK